MLPLSHNQHLSAVGAINISYSTVFQSIVRVEQDPIPTTACIHFCILLTVCKTQGWRG